ncbi:hypothetical protein B0H17DRAFT_1140119 [Mycena rosella]|uniref:Uncharacterized protein n=1 Tax=Mycena rosella TaxID=1033263 RepID=A0AAD7D388_MYCRO|nr:hypothetical protein B0H17DRAFT_1140119 [Mycena rosella]
MGDWELIRAVLASRDTDEQYQRVNTDCSSRFLLTSYHDIAQPRFVLWLCGRPLLTGNHDIVQPRFLMASNHIAQLSMQLLPDGIIDKPPSPSDKPGFLYEFLILEDDEDEDEDTDRRHQVRTSCASTEAPGQRQRWQFCWKVPFAAKFGAYPSYLFSSSLDQRAEFLIHEHLKRTGAWLGPSTCSFCDVTHHKKFDFDRCGGMDGLIKVVEAYLRRLGWPVLRYEVVLAYSSAKNSASADAPASPLHAPAAFGPLGPWLVADSSLSAKTSPSAAVEMRQNFFCTPAMCLDRWAPWFVANPSSSAKNSIQSSCASDLSASPGCVWTGGRHRSSSKELLWLAFSLH